MLLTIKNDFLMIRPVQAAASVFAEILGFEVKDRRHIELLIEEILSNVIKYGFFPEQIEDITIELKKTTLCIVIHISSLSIPIDIDKIHSFEKMDVEAITMQGSQGIGFQIINKIANSIRYVNKGREGQHIIVEKYLSQELTSQTNADFSNTLNPKKITNFDYYVRWMKPSESSSISKLAYNAYRLSCFNEYIYYPERVRQLNQTGEMLNAVAVTIENEDIIGHGAAKNDRLSDMVEFSSAFVNTDYRGAGCLKKITEFMISHFKEANIIGAFVTAVASHPYSQKSSYDFGFRECALLLSRLTPMEMQQIERNIKYRESLLMMVLFWKNDHNKIVYAPSHHAGMIQQIYKNINQFPKYLNAESYQPQLHNETSLEINNDNYKCAHIHIFRYGIDICRTVERTLKLLCVDRIETVYLYLPLSSAETATQCALFESLGFFFAGISPGKDGQDWLVLQYLNNQICPYDSLHFACEFSYILSRYIQSCDPNSSIKSMT